MFVMRAKVTLESVEAELVSIGLSGPDAKKILTNAAGFAPSGDNGCETREDVTITSLPGPHPRYEIIAPTTAAEKLWESLKTKATPVGPAVWAWLDIMAGIPSVHPGTNEEFVPQMANLEIVGGVNFKKGCYPGQEIVARAQYRGQIKRRMVRVRTPVSLRPGQDLYADDVPGQPAGTVVNVAGDEALAVLQISTVESGSAVRAEAGGSALEVLPLPYQA
jgi:hypothetical protein